MWERKGLFRGNAILVERTRCLHWILTVDFIVTDSIGIVRSDVAEERRCRQTSNHRTSHTDQFSVSWKGAHGSHWPIPGWHPGTDLGEGCRGCASSPPPLRWPAVFLYNWYSAKKKTMWFIGVEVEQETSAPPPKKNPGSAPGIHAFC